ncbi:MAG: glycosyltransferase family 25 protein [Burkholderiaceae bacterium]|jgi:glycosyl transferase family 25|nr:glycosyltransferase family 25 protein [Burkholderiaceae bacterium]
MSSRVPTFYINLDHDAGRREALECQLNALGLPHSRFPGVYGKALPADELARHYDHARAIAESRELTVGEVGCALSHLGVYRAMIAQDLPYALVLEDDAKLGPDVPAVLDALTQQVSPDEPVVTLLTHIDRYYKRSARPLTASHATVRLANYQWLAHGYFVTRAAAKRMAEQLYPVWLAADYWYKFEREGIVKMQAVVPYVIGVQNFDSGSNLEADRAVKSREADDRLGFGHHVRQLLVRKFLYQIFVRPFLGLAKQKKTW